MANFAGTAAIDACLDSNAAFQAHIKGIRDLLLGGGNGLVLDTNSNEIAWDTVTLPSTNTYATGSAVFKFQDTMQATFPLFLKARMGISNIATRPQWEWQMGTGHNGAGNLTGKVTSAQVCNTFATKTTGVKLDAYCCVMDGGAYLLMNNDGATPHAPFGMFAERTLGVGGTPTADGAILIGKSYNTGGNSQVISALDPQPASVGTEGALFNGEIAASWAQPTNGANVATQPADYWTAAKNWRTRVQAHRGGDLSPYTPITGGDWKGCQRWMSFNGSSAITSTSYVLMPYQN